MYRFHKDRSSQPYLEKHHHTHHSPSLSKQGHSTGDESTRGTERHKTARTIQVRVLVIVVVVAVVAVGRRSLRSGSRGECGGQLDHVRGTGGRDGDGGGCCGGGGGEVGG